VSPFFLVDLGVNPVDLKTAITHAAAERKED
jgi:hypothetical protein